MSYIGKILPVEGYYVRLNNPLPEGYAVSLTHLYQPLIGIQAVMLYQTLLHDIPLQQEGSPQTHHSLMNYSSLPLDEIYQARRKLEGIGLLKTYKKEAMPQNIYMYELQRTFAPEEFFADAMLAQLLQHHIGEDKFAQLKNHFAKNERTDAGSDVTAGFHDVFQTFTPTVVPTSENTNNKVEQHKTAAIDFAWIKQMLKQRMIPSGKVLTAENRRLIQQMMELYDLAAHDVEKALMWALTEDNRLHTEEFKSACHDLFKAAYGNPRLQLSAKQEKATQPHSEPATKEEQLIHALETSSPKQLLEDLSSGNHASEQDMKAIREVMASQGLPSPVMNVLIHYVLLQSNMKLSKAYLEKIASHWSRANLKTAKEAMVFAKQEKERFQKGKAQRQSNRKQASKEIVPEWFKDRKTAPSGSTAQAPQNRDALQEQEEIADLLKQLSSKK
ncbi:replication initiation and membrane attachment family protein [Lentibacillus sediminis]|uniref:replication initiation and membrane attachment family protein n=1 Tax=Lentibacillus sediminis TaxID=1940529 RepID=UPI000C1B95DA|nr:DnaD domain protein [Lentibacillus sediminis]